jgi:hypothetical protein
MFYVLIQLFDSSVQAFKYLAFSICASIVYDIIFLIIHIVPWWHGYTSEGSDESGLRVYSIVMTIILILYKIVECLMFMHTAESYGVLILPAKKALKTKYRMEMRMYQARLKGRNLKDLYKSTRFPNDTPQYVDLIWDEDNQGYDMTDVKDDKKSKKRTTEIDSINAPKTDRNSNPPRKKKTQFKV